MRPPRLNPALEEHERECQHIHDMVLRHEEQLKHLVMEQERLCSRLQACRSNSR
jgi:flagellar biosynthesis chaperone FliJ